jgi:anhydro-N-acetylmuramic acid kinase
MQVPAAAAAAEVATGLPTLGLISGTSADGVDAALALFDPAVTIVAARTIPYPDALRERLLALTRGDAAVSLDDYGALDVTVGECFAQAALALLADAGVTADEVAAIGSHGQTVRHRPDGGHPFTLQIGDPAVIAERTGIVTVADFRRADVAAGGQGAPLMPAFHRAVLGRRDAVRVVLNLGGIANVTVLDPDRDVTGFDTGPASCLLDAWAERHLHRHFDTDGAWGASGRGDPALLAGWLADPYLARSPPKSTGREAFNLDWLDARVPAGIAAADVQATLLAFSARSIADAIRVHAPDAADVVACGGGVHNGALMRRLAAELSPCPLLTSDRFGLDPDHVEATGFAWLARERLAGRPGNLTSVTGARGPRLLGAIYARS